MPHFIAMWSGPRNISTAMMRSWGSRPDTVVIDEPFYAHYLIHTPHRDDHPGAEEVIASQENDWRKVVDHLTGDIPDGKEIFYQKHMTHHMLDHIDLGWTSKVTNCFLIRNPAEVIASFIKVIPHVEIDQTGLPQQIRLFEKVRAETGRIPPVIDSADVLREPRGTLSRLCEAIGVPFLDAMLSWEPGRRATDGVWAKYWYAAVEASTAFKQGRQSYEKLPDSLNGLLEECTAIYEQMAVHRLT